MSRRARTAAVSAAMAGLSPGYFALVMATGIVSVGLNDVGLTAPSRALLWAAAASYAILVVLTAIASSASPTG